jgi:Flp pilus assembly protein TadD
MAKGPSDRVRIAALILALVGSVLALAPAQAQVAVGFAESPADALARNMKLLGSSPRNFNALIGAGRAALALGDTQAAAGFFGRAEEVWPSSPLAQAGMGAALALDGDGRGALQYFARAVQRGATASMIGCDRGLAYDLLGQHAQAQADYRAALAGADRDEARRRLALSLAITGNKAEALSTLAPLMARGDAAAARTRVFVLALTGDTAGAKAALDAAMPGSSSRMVYFFQKLPSLRSDQKAAAVNLGFFPGSAVQSASPGPVTTLTFGSGTTETAKPDRDRIDSIQQWLAQTAPQQSAARPPAAQTASVALPPRATGQPARKTDLSAAVVPMGKRRYWVQLASGRNAAALPEQFHRIKSRYSDMLQGINGYVAQEPDKYRLLIGPFASSADASDFADALESARVSAFTWTSDPGQTIRKLPTE